jgi:hypothetical protein
MSARLAGDNDVTCPLVLQVLWKHTSLAACLGS